MGAGESLSGRLESRFTGYNAVSDAANAASDFAVGQGLGASDVARLCIIIEELVANLYEHGGLAQSATIELSLLGVPEGIAIRLSDPGHPFDPRTATSSKPRPDRGGGAGIDLVAAWTKFVEYSVRPGQNRLELLMSIRRDDE